MRDITWKDSHIEVEPPKRTKKLTGTRFASIFGLNPYASPFETWCAVTKTWEKPFEDTVYTLAGKAIEPKQARFMVDTYMMDNLRTPTDVFGPDFFNATHGDFFRNTDVFGGMWDYLLTDENGKPTTVLEMKTTKKAEDWQSGIPEYYAQQAALYAYLLDVDDVIMVVSVLDPEKGDYQHPEDFVCTPQNTFTVPFKLSERYPDFADRVKEALDWWRDHVMTGISPDYDEKRDKEILDALRTSSVTPTDDMTALIAEAEALRDELARNAAQMKEKEDRLKTITEFFKKTAKAQFLPGETDVLISGSKYTWKCTRSVSWKVDEKKLKADGLYDLYAAPAESFRMTVIENKQQ